jgi:arylsulfatase A-like enzyme
MILILRLVLAAALLLPALAAGERPLNVVFILADDLGWSDCTLHGTTRLYQTPNLERLARRGTTFTRAYTNSPLCSPTRASLLTGRSVARHGISAPVGHLPQALLEPVLPERGPAQVKTLMPQSATRLRTDHLTLGMAFKESGYATGHFGKWHLGVPPHSPLQHGFGVDLPHDSGPGPRRGFVGVWSYPQLQPRGPQEHIEDRMPEEAAKFIGENKDRPFFLNYWQFSVHAPFDAKKELIEKYRPLTRPGDAQRSPTYAAMVESMDDAVGTLLDALERHGVADRTVIVFTSDNGGNMYNQIDEAPPTSNAPLRGGKATLWEGGVRVPCIVAWPELSEAGSRSDEIIQTSDFFPTFVDLLKIKAPSEASFDGISIAKALQGGSLERGPIFMYFPHSPKVPDTLPPGIAVVTDDWKLIRLFHDGPDGSHRHLLFHLKEDLGETRDLAAEQPQRVLEMGGWIDAHLAETRALVPRPNPAYRAVGGDTAGWIAGKGSELELVEGALVIASSSADPWARRPVPRLTSESTIRLTLRLKSTGAGAGQVMWTEQRNQAFNGKQRAVNFTPVHDGEARDYVVELPTKSLAGIRIDPGTAPGTYTIERLHIDAGSGALFTWPPSSTR